MWRWRRDPGARSSHQAAPCAARCSTFRRSCRQGRGWRMHVGGHMAAAGGAGPGQAPALHVGRVACCLSMQRASRRSTHPGWLSLLVHSHLQESVVGGVGAVLSGKPAAGQAWSTCYTVTPQIPGAAAVEEGYCQQNVLASYVHLHFGNCPDFAAALVQRCRGVDVAGVAAHVLEAVQTAAYLESAVASLRSSPQQVGGATLLLCIPQAWCSRRVLCMQTQLPNASCNHLATPSPFLCSAAGWQGRARSCALPLLSRLHTGRAASGQAARRSGGDSRGAPPPVCRGCVCLGAARQPGRPCTA